MPPRQLALPPADRSGLPSARSDIVSANPGANANRPDRATLPPVKRVTAALGSRAISRTSPLPTAEPPGPGRNFAVSTTSLSPSPGTGHVRASPAASTAQPPVAGRKPKPRRAVTGPARRLILSPFTSPPCQRSRPSPRTAPANGRRLSGRPFTLAMVNTRGAVSGASFRSAMKANVSPSSRSGVEPASCKDRAVVRASITGANKGPAAFAVITSPPIPSSRACAALSARTSRACVSDRRSLLRFSRPRAVPDIALPFTFRDRRAISPSGAASAVSASPPASRRAAGPVSNCAGSMRPSARSWPPRPEIARSASGAVTPAKPACTLPAHVRHRPRPLAVAVSGRLKPASVVTIPPAGASSRAVRAKRSRSGSASRSRCKRSPSPSARASSSTTARPARISVRPLAVMARGGPAMPAARSSRPSANRPMMMSCAGSRRGSLLGFRIGRRVRRARGMLMLSATN